MYAFIGKEGKMGQIDVKLFCAAKPKTAVEIIIDSIKNLLITKQVRPGDKLPSENELAESLQISRGSVREAMKILSSFGIVTIKRGDGTYVSDNLTGGLIDPILFQFILTDFDKTKLLELRELMEIGMMKLIVKKASDASIRKIREVHEKMVVAVESGRTSSRELAQLDRDFHAAIVAATDNPLIQKIYGFVMEMFLPSLETSVMRGNHGKFSVELHSNIIDALETRNLDNTVKEVELSIEQWFNLI